MAEREALRRLGGLVQVDDACLGGKRTGCKTEGAVPGVRWINRALDNVEHAASGRWQTVKQGGQARRHSATAWYHLHRRSPVAAMLSRVKYTAVLCNPWPERICGLWETFMAGWRNLIRCGRRHRTMPWVVQRRPAPIVNAVPLLSTTCDDSVNSTRRPYYGFVRCV